MKKCLIGKNSWTVSYTHLVAETTEDTSTKAKATKAKKEEKVVETEEIELELED